MQPFPVICETCRAQLRVRSRRMVGEIHSCPKCGGMVLIQPPPGWENAPSESSAAFAAMKPATIATLQPPLAETPSFYEVGDLTGIDLDTPAGPSAAAEVSATSVERWGRRVVWGSVVGSAAIVAVSLVWALWPHNGELRRSTIQLAEAGDSPLSQEETAVDESPGAVAPAVAHAPEAKPELVPIIPPPAEFDLPPLPPPAEAPAPVAKAPQVEPPVEPKVAIPPPQPVIDPRDVDPENLDLILRKNPANEPAPSNVEAGTGKLAPAGPAPVVADGGDALALAKLESALAEAAKDARPETVRRGPTSTIDLEPINTDQLLQVVIPEIDVPRLPLSRAVKMLGELTSIPITLDPAALRMAGLSVNHEVSIRGQSATSAELIRGTLAEVKLEYEQRGNQLIVVRPGREKVGKRTYRVDDLLPEGAHDAASIGQLIQTFVSPEAWEERGGEGKINVEQTQLAVTQSQAIHYDALILCERLRKARGMPLQSRYPENLLRTKPLDAALAPQLDRKTTFSFVVWTKLPQVFDYWQQATELTILIDWSSLADVQLSPDSTIACAVEGVSWREAFDEVLAPLGLAWLPVEEETIQITTRAAAESKQFVEFHALPKSGDAAVLVEQLKQQIPDGEVAFDSTSRLLLVRANAADQRTVAMQLSLAEE